MTSSADHAATVRLLAWAKDVQLSNRTGFPHYANPSELKADIHALADRATELERGVDNWMSRAHYWNERAGRAENALRQIIRQYDHDDDVQAHHAADRARAALGETAPLTGGGKHAGDDGTDSGTPDERQRGTAVPAPADPPPASGETAP